MAHFGDEDKAFRLVDLAADAGADAVKFQVFNVDDMISGELADWKARLGPRALPYDAFARIQAYCKERGITFFATAHDEPSLDFLASLDVPLFKVGSGRGRQLAVPEEGGVVPPADDLFHRHVSHRPGGGGLDAIAEAGGRDVAVLHCVTLYPTPPEQGGARDDRAAARDLRCGGGIFRPYPRFPHSACGRGALGRG